MLETETNASRQDFCFELAPHLADAMSILGIEDADLSDGRMLADVVYGLGYRLPATSPAPTANGAS